MSLTYQAPAQLSSQHSGQLLGVLDTILQQDDALVDFSQLLELDSSTVALLLEWQRRAQRAQRRLTFIALPDTLKQLIQVYGVQDLLQIKP